MLGPFATTSRRTPIHPVSLVMPPAHRCPRQRRRQQRQRVPDGTAMAPINLMPCVFLTFCRINEFVTTNKAISRLWEKVIQHSYEQWGNSLSYPNSIKYDSNVFCNYILTAINTLAYIMSRMPMTKICRSKSATALKQPKLENSFSIAC